MSATQISRRAISIRPTPLLAGVLVGCALVAGSASGQVHQAALDRLPAQAPATNNTWLRGDHAAGATGRTNLSLSRQILEEIEQQGRPLEIADSRAAALSTAHDPAYSSARLAALPAAAPGAAHRSPAARVAGREEPWRWQFLPVGLVYQPYLAGVREPRFGAQIYHERDEGWMLDASLGARVGLFRYGTDDPIAPQGWQLDAEAAAFPRLTIDEYRDMVSADFRYGLPLTYRDGAWEWKFAFYHLSSHLADEYMLSGLSYQRLNFVRDGFVLGLGWYATPDVRLYAETGWAFHTDGGSEPWEFQFGLDYSPLEPIGSRGAPFLALNGHLRQEVDFGGNFTLQAGWQWRDVTGKLLRFGLHYLNGQSDQYQFYTEHEEQIGFGLWYDF